jgi:hypothetical protein
MPDDPKKTFHVNKCPQKLIDRINAKAALKGKKPSKWVIEVLERETKKLVEIQEDYRREDGEEGASPGDDKPK